jgi:hypothetical protein
MPDQAALNVRIAADARVVQTDYHDDQTWELTFGRRQDEPAVTVQTRYGGRVGLARLVPAFVVNGRSFYERGTLAEAFQLTTFAPDSFRVEGEPVSGLRVAWFVSALDSHTLGGRFTLTNRGNKPLVVGVELFFQAIREDKLLKANQLQVQTPDGMAAALSIPKVGNLTPVLLLERGQETGAAKLMTPLTIPPGKSSSLRFVLASLPTLDESLGAAYQAFIQTDWQQYLKTVNERLAKLPVIDTDDEALDAAIAFSQQVLLRSLMSPPEQSTHPFPVFVRTPATGYGAWDRQSALDIFHYTAALAVLEPQLAQGVIRHYLATQQPDGWIGDSDGRLLLPMLAQLTESVYRYSRDDKFLQEVLPALLKFYARWFAEDRFPAWTSPQQAGFEFHPIFSQGADSRLVKSPDLAAYLLCEGDALKHLAERSGKQAQWAKVAKHHETLAAELGSAWNKDEGRFYYLDRDSNQSLFGETIFSGNGEQALTYSVHLTTPNRLLIQAEGGASHPPKLRVLVRGLDIHGKDVQEVIEAFQWQRLRGTATSRTIWRGIDRIQVEGLSRVYKYTVTTVDLSQHDITLLLPYMTTAITAEQTKRLMTGLEDHYWGEYGLSSLPKGESRHSEFGRHVVLPWVTLLGLAMLRRGETRLSAELFQKVAAAQVKALVAQGSFFQWYHADEGTGLGMADHASGLIPLHWLIALAGVVVHDSQTVEITGAFALKRGIKIKWHGVRLTRNSRSLKIKFPNGQERELPPDAKPQIITAS